MRTFNLVKSLTKVNNITSLPFRKGLGLGRLILCLSLAILGVNEVWGNGIDISGGGFKDKVSGNNISLGGSHVAFTFSGSIDSYSAILSKVYLDDIRKGSTNNYTLSWSANTGCTISVTKITIEGNHTASGEVTLTGATKNTKNEFSISTTSISGTSVTLSCLGTTGLKSTPNYFYISHITIEYTVTPDNPTIKSSTASINVTLDTSNPEKITLSEYFSTTEEAHFNPLLAGNVDPNSNFYCQNNQFYATAADTYSINAYIAATDNCHAQSGASSSALTVTVNRLQPRVEMNNGEVTVYTDAGPHTLDLNTLKKATNKTNGDYTYELLGTDAEKRGASISGSTFKSTVGGTFMVRATTSQTGQYESATYDFQVTVNRLTPTVTWTPNEDTFVAEEQIAVTSAPGVELNLSAEGAGAEYVTIDNNNKIFIIEDYSGATPITATLKVTSAQTDVYEAISGLTKSITISNLTKQHIIWDQDQALMKLKITDDPRSIVLTATSDNGGPVSRYVLEGETTGFSLSQNGDAWTLNYPNTASKGAFVRAELDGVEDQYLPASPISLPIKVVDPTSACDITENLATVSGLKNDKKEYALAIPKSVYLHVRRTNREWYALYTNGIEIEFQNAQGSRVGNVVTKSQNDIDDDCDITIDNLDRSITKMIFKSNAGYGYDITVANYTHHSEIGKNEDNLAFETYVGTPVDNQQVIINYANHQIEVSIEDVKIDGVTNASSNFSIISGSSFGDCGVSGSNTMTIGYTVPGYPCTETATLCVRDNTRALLTSLPLSATVLGGLDQHINFINLPQTFSTTDKVTLQATSDREFEHQFTYSVVSGYTDIAKVEGDKLTFLKDGDFKLRVYEPGTKLYTEAEAFTDVLHVSKVTPTIVTLPTVGDAITYGSKLSDVALSGGSAKDDKGNAVAGHFEWTSPDEIPHGGQQNYTVRFVPDNTNMYASDAVSTETLTITVNKADQTLTWDVDSPIKIKKEDGDYTMTASSTSGRAITYTLSDPSLGTINGSTLTPLKSGDCTITAVCQADNDYNASNSIGKQLLIAGPDEIVWKYKNGDHVWAGQNLNADGKLATAHTPVWFGKDETQWYLTVVNETNPKTVYSESASDGTLVTISASTSGDGYYASISSSIQVYIDRCYQGLVWNQNFLSYLADEQGHIDQTEDLTAYAVDSLNKKTDLPIVYSVDNPDVAEIVGDATNGWKLHIIGAGSATLTASVDQTNIYQGVTETRKINVRKEGEHCGSYALISTGEKKIGDIDDNTYTFKVPGETLTFKTRKFVAITLNADVIVEGWNIKENAWQNIDSYTLNFTSNQTKTYSLNENIRKIRMSTNSTIENNYRYISDLYITQKEYIRSSVDKIDEKIYINQDFSKTFTVDYSDKPYISCTIDNDQLEIIRDDDSNTCGESGTITFTVKGKNSWTTPSQITGTITLSTSVGDNITIPVTVTIDLGGTYKFTNKSGDNDWNNLQNWDYGGSVPTSLPDIMNPVEIQQPVRIDREVKIYGLKVETEATQGWDGSVTIAPTGGLTVYNGGVSGLNGKLTIESSREHTGYFRVVPDVVKNWVATPTATMQYASKGSLDTGADKDATWQYFGIPVNSADFTVDYITWLYEWSEPNGWIDLKSAAQPVQLKPFQGYAITQYGQPIYDFTGSLNMGKTDLHLTCTTTENGMWGDNMFANSYPSPIDIKLFTEEDVEDLDHRTIYLYNSGSWNDWNKGTQGGDWGHLTDGAGAPGTFTAIPILAATYLGTEQTLIAPMQGICIHTDNATGATVHLDYAKHVWDAMPAGSKDNMTAPLLAPAHKGTSQKPEGVSDEVWEEVQYAQYRRDSIAEAHKQKVAELRHRVRLTVYGENSGADHIYLLEKDGFTADYDNGYDAYKMFNDGPLNLYTNEDFGQMAVSARNSIDSTYIGIEAGEDDVYQLIVSSVIGDSLLLFDTETSEIFALTDSAIYTFYAAPNQTNDFRFRIIDFGKRTHEQGYDTPTSWQDINGTNVHVWYARHKLYIADAQKNSLARIYTANGTLVSAIPFDYATSINVENLAAGVYIVRVNNTNHRFVTN